MLHVYSYLICFFKLYLSFMFMQSNVFLLFFVLFGFFCFLFFVILVINYFFIVFCYLLFSNKMGSKCTKYTYQMKYMHVWHICQLKSKGLDGRGHFKALFISFKWRALLMKIKKNVQISKHRNLDFFLYKIIINCQKYHIQKFKVDLMVHLLTINWSLLKRTKLNSRVIVWEKKEI